MNRDRLARLGVALGAGLLVYASAVLTEAHGATLDANGNVARLISVETAAGIRIRVAPSFAGKIEGFIRDLVARGYKPHRIGCYSWARSHVRHSLHHTGEACDFDQRGWGKTAHTMYHVHALARKWGLRDGCSFKDCGHIDAGRSQESLAARRHRRTRK